MVRRLATRIGRRLRRLVQRDPDRFLRRCRGVVHVGANTGQERAAYDRLGLRVVWIEPIPEIFRQLCDNLAAFPKQRAIQALVADRDGVEHAFHVATNSGESSSLFDLKLHRDIWPQVGFERTLTLHSRTLASLLRDERVELADYDALVIDAQGAELLVLQGAAPILEHFTYIRAEAADFESYAGCCLLPDLVAFLDAHGYRELSRTRMAGHPTGGAYYEVVFRRRE